MKVRILHSVQCLVSNQLFIVTTILKCELCDGDHEGFYGSGRFCSKKCARAFSTHKSRNEINEKVSQTLVGRSRRLLRADDKRLLLKVVIDENQLREEIKFAVSFRNLALRMNLSLNQVHKVKKTVQRLGLDYSHFRLGRAPEKVLCRSNKRGDLRGALLKSEREYKCEECGLTSKWQEKKLTLHVDHIDGDNENHEASNLRFLCPNCHSQTDTFSWKNVRRKKLLKNAGSSPALPSACSAQRAVDTLTTMWCDVRERSKTGL